MKEINLRAKPLVCLLSFLVLSWSCCCWRILVSSRALRLLIFTIVRVVNYFCLVTYVIKVDLQASFFLLQAVIPKGMHENQQDDCDLNVNQNVFCRRLSKSRHVILFCLPYTLVCHWLWLLRLPGILLTLLTHVVLAWSSPFIFCLGGGFLRKNEYLFSN